MNLKTNTISFDLVPELFIDKFDEKVKKLKENEVGCFSNMDVKTINANNKIYIFLIKSNGNDYEENDEDIDKYFEECDTYYAITINDFKINISAVKTFKTNTDFESILHIENIMASLVNETIQEIKNEISSIRITKDDAENYIKDINVKIRHANLPETYKPAKIYIQAGNNSDRVGVTVEFYKINKILAIYNNGKFTDIRISIENCYYDSIEKRIQELTNTLKAFQYYVYCKYCENTLYTLYKRKYENLIDELRR